VIGRDILLNGLRFQVVGVAREGFYRHERGCRAGRVRPIVMERTFYRSDVMGLTSRETGWVTIMGRLKSRGHPHPRRDRIELLVAADP